jgi:hypothetical protein
VVEVEVGDSITRVAIVGEAERMAVIIVFSGFVPEVASTVLEVVHW